MEGDTTRTRSEFKNELNENQVQFVRIRDKNIISFYVSLKGLCCIYIKSVLSFYFEIDIEQNLHFCP